MSRSNGPRKPTARGQASKSRPGSPGKSRGPAKPAQRRPSLRQMPGGPAVVGKHPRSPALLGMVGAMWLAVSAFVLLAFKASWKLIPVVVAAGIGLLYLRGAAVSYLRRDQGNQKH